MTYYIVFTTLFFLIHCIYREGHDVFSKVTFYEKFALKKNHTKLLVERSRLTGKPVQGVFGNCIVLAITYWMELLSLLATISCLFLVPQWLLPVALIPFIFLVFKKVFKPTKWFRRVDAGFSCVAYSIVSAILLTSL
jgi:hypothetical protein